MSCSPTDWIEAGCAVAMVGLTGWTLSVLRAYAADTKTIAAMTADQMEASQRPFLTLEFPGGADGALNHSEAGMIRNRGQGVALNIELNTPQSMQVAQRWPSSLANGDVFIAFKDVMPVRWAPMIGYVMEYDALSGRRYRTTLFMDKAFRLETKFEEVARLSSRPEPEIY